MTFVDVVLSLVVLVPMGALGVALLWRARLGLDPLEWVAYGVPLGWVVSSLVLLGVSSLIGRLSGLVIAAGLMTIVVVLAWLWGTAPIGRSPRTDPNRSIDGTVPETDHGSADEVVMVQATDVTTDEVGALTQRDALALADRTTRQIPTGLGSGRTDRQRPMLDQIGGLSGSAIGASVARALGRVRDHFSPLPVIVFGVIFLIWIKFWTRVIQYDPELTFSFTTTHFIADWPMHLGDVASMVYGNNFPMQAPRFAGATYNYHYLATFTAAAITKLGVLPGYALALHSLFGLGFCLLGLYAFARRLLRRTGVAVLGTLLFYLGGSFAWLLTVQKFNASGSLWHTLRYEAWDFGGYDTSRQFEWNQVLAHVTMAQRAFIYGIPLFLLILTLLLLGLRRNRLRLFVAAAVVTGTLPYANGSVALVLPMILPFLALLFPVRPFTRSPMSWVRAYPVKHWLWFGLIAAVLVAPQVYFQQSSGDSALDIRWSPGFDLGTRTDVGRDPWWWYAVKNFGYLLVLIPLGFLLRNALTSSSRRLLLAIMPLFPISQLVTFQPLQGDNAKLVLLWYLAGALVAAAAIAELWRRARSIVPKVFLVGVTTSLLMSGILIHIALLDQNDLVGIATADELAVGERVRNETPPDGLFAAGQWHTMPILMIGGRSILVGWVIHVEPHGHDMTEHEAALREIMQYGADAEADIARYGVDYVAITPAEIESYDANPDVYAANYPLVIEEGDFQIFAVSPEAIELARATGVPVPDTSAN